MGALQDHPQYQRKDLLSSYLGSKLEWQHEGSEDVPLAISETGFSILYCDIIIEITRYMVW